MTHKAKLQAPSSWERVNFLTLIGISLPAVGDRANKAEEALRFGTAALDFTDLTATSRLKLDAESIINFADPAARSNGAVNRALQQRRGTCAVAERIDLATNHPERLGIYPSKFLDNARLLTLQAPKTD